MNLSYLRRTASHKLTSLVTVTAMLCLTAVSASADWDDDGVVDAEDWGVALTFDVHSWENVDHWNYPSDWSAWKPSILDLLTIYGAEATFFVSDFGSMTRRDYPWEPPKMGDLLDDAVSRGNELAWHGRQHIDYPKWQCSSGQYAWSYVNNELYCEAPAYDQARASHWPTDLQSYAYPGGNCGNPGHTTVDSVLSYSIGHARGAGGVQGPYPTTTIGNTFRLAGFWLDNVSLCSHSGCLMTGAIQQINDAYNNNKVVVFAAHHFTTAATGTEHAIQVGNLITILEHVKCLREGGTLVGDACQNPTGVVDNSNVYHTFDELPQATTASVPRSYNCPLQSLSACSPCP